MFEASLNEHQRRLDRLQIVALCGLMLLGIAFVYSARMVSETNAVWHNQSWFRQLIWYVLGTSAAITVCVVDYWTIARWAYLLYWMSIVPLVAVLVPHIGTTHGWGAMRWFDLGFFQLQPSEFAKLAFILAQAHFLSRPIEEVRQPVNFWKAIGLMLLPFVLIMKEPDLGSALVLVPTGMAMLFVAGAPRKYLLWLVGGVGFLGALLLVDILFVPPGWWQIKLEPYQRQRLLVYFGADFAPPNASIE